MEDKRELYENTKKLLRDLNHFLIHVILYFTSNAVLTYIIFEDITTRWWMFFFVLSWALGLIYHALRVYGIDIIKGKDKHLSKMWSWV